MAVKQVGQFEALAWRWIRKRVQAGRVSDLALAVMMVILGAPVGSGAQMQPPFRLQMNPSSAENPFYGSVTAHRSGAQALRLSLDDAIGRGLENNLALKESEASVRVVQGQRLEAMQLLLPTIRLNGSTAYHQVNLRAMGFGPAILTKLGLPKNTPYITRADVNQGAIVYSQTLFSGPVMDALKGVAALRQAADFERMETRNKVVQQVAATYLAALAAASQVDNAKALEAADRALFDQTHEKHAAGVVANLDELRARVEMQAQQQRVIATENSLAKYLIFLKREIGIDSGQAVELTDRTPYNDLAARTPAEVCAEAYRNRQDYQSLKAQVVEARAESSGYKHQRWPTLSFNGDYAVTAVNGAGTHGNFAAVGRLSFPIFREASLRGDVHVAEAKLMSARYQLANLTTEIDQQVRSALLDVEASSKLVLVARSNVELSQQALRDETDRVNAGIDDNLPLVQAQSALAAAETNRVESLYQYNLAKLSLAQATGVVEQQYRVYLGR